MMNYFIMDFVSHVQKDKICPRQGCYGNKYCNGWTDSLMAKHFRGKKSPLPRVRRRKLWNGKCSDQWKQRDVRTDRDKASHISHNVLSERGRKTSFIKENRKIQGLFWSLRKNKINGICDNSYVSFIKIERNS